MKKIVLVLGIALLGGVFFFGMQREEKPKIALFQTASHPALDQAREGFLEEVRRELGEEFAIVEHNAQGGLADARTIAKKISQDRGVKTIFTIGSLATQMMATIEKDKPILFSAVTDPALLGIPDGAKNITGCRDKVESRKLLELCRKVVPQAKKVSILFHPPEVGSAAMAEEIASLFENEGFEVLRVGIQLESEVALAAATAARQGDVIITPVDNVVASSAALIAHQAKKQNKPLIVSDNLLLKFGAQASCGVDYKECGKQAGRMCVKVLKQGIAVQEIPIENARGTK